VTNLSTLSTWTLQEVQDQSATTQLNLCKPTIKFVWSNGIKLPLLALICHCYNSMLRPKMMLNGLCCNDALDHVSPLLELLCPITGHIVLKPEVASKYLCTELEKFYVICLPVSNQDDLTCAII
jgi:hypothetical protein